MQSLASKSTSELFQEQESWAASNRLAHLVCIEEDPVWCKEQFEDLQKVLLTAKRCSAMGIPFSLVTHAACASVPVRSTCTTFVT